MKFKIVKSGVPDADTSPQGRGIYFMKVIELPIEQYQRLMDSILWILGPFLEEDGFEDHPHLVELAECYNELYHKIPLEDHISYPHLTVHQIGQNITFKPEYN